MDKADNGGESAEDELHVQKDIQTVILDFYKSKKYIGLSQNSPILIAKMLG